MRSIICYIPEELPEDNINFICSDNKVHMRFRDFDSPCVIAGFEHKLTYLLTYLMNYSYLQNALFCDREDQLLAGFLKTKDIAEINTCIRTHTANPKYKGIKLRKKYSKVHDHSYKAFGNVNIAAFPVHVENSVIMSGDLAFFLNAFKISLKDYLFNDNYIVVIDEIQIREMNKKFINKMNKKLELTSTNRLDVIELW